MSGTLPPESFSISAIEFCGISLCCVAKLCASGNAALTCDGVSSSGFAGAVFTAPEFALLAVVFAAVEVLFPLEPLEQAAANADKITASTTTTIFFILFLLFR